MDFIKKYKSLMLGVVVSVFLLGGLVAPTPVKAQTVAELQAMIQALMQQIAVSIAQQEGGSDNGGQCQLVRNMGVNESGWGVSFLQKFLNRNGYVVTTSGSGSPGQEGTNFDENTRVALARYQAAKRINPANGYLGPITRANINSQLTLADCGTDDEGTTGKFRFAIIGGMKNTYNPGDSIALRSINVLVDDEDVANKSAGFNIQAYIFKGSNTNGNYLPPSPSGSYNARFNNQDGEWEIDMDAPKEPGEYTLKMTVYCSRPNSDCDEKYGIGGNVSKTLPFRVVSDDDEDVSIDVDLISATAEASGIDGSGPGDMSLGMFRIKYRVTAIGGDVFIALNCGLDNSRYSANYSVVASNVVMGSSPCSLDSIPKTNNSRNVVTIKEGKSKEFDLRASSRAENGSGNVYLRLNSIKWSNSLDEDAVFQDYKDLSSLRTAPLFLRSYNITDPVEEPEITVTSPGDNSHVYKSGDVMNIVYSWNRFSYVPRFNIDLYSMDNKVATIATNTTGGRYSWVVPSNLTTANNFRVNVYSGDVDAWSGRFTINANGPSTVPAIRGVNIDNYQTPWTNRTAKTIRWNYSDLPQTGLKFKVGLYTNLNGGMWGNSVFVNAVGTSGTAVTSLDPRIGEPYFNKDYFIMVRLYNADGTEFRPQGRRIETIGTQIFQVVPPTTGMVNKEAQLASIYNTLENMLEGLLK